MEMRGRDYAKGREKEKRKEYHDVGENANEEKEGE